MRDEQINEVMRLADEIADYAWKQGLSDGAYSQADHDRKSCDASRAELKAYLRTIGEPACYSLPAGSIGAKKFAQVGGGFTPVGLVFSRGESAMAITEHGRVYWDRDLVHPISGEPESMNAELLEALKSAKNGLEWYQDAHPESASECDSEAMQEIDAAIARAESAIESSPKPVALPAMKAAFRTTCVGAGEFIMAFKFRDIEDMDRADDEWRAVMAIETPAKVSPCAGHAWQAARLAGQRAMREQEPEPVNARLLAIVHQTVGMIENTSIETGYCCCGDSMDGHASPMICGHCATDQGAYLAGLLYEDAKAAIAAAKTHRKPLAGADTSVSPAPSSATERHLKGASENG